MIYKFSFLNELFLSNTHHFSLIVINRDIFLYGILMIGHCYWEGVNQTLFDSIVSFTLDSHRYPILSTQIPISHMSNSSISSTSSTTFSSSTNNFSSSFLYSWNKLFVKPILVNILINSFSIDFGIDNIRKHGRRMISPNTEITYFIKMAVQFLSQLSQRSIMV